MNKDVLVQEEFDTKTKLDSFANTYAQLNGVLGKTDQLRYGTYREKLRNVDNVLLLLETDFDEVSAKRREHGMFAYD